MWGYSFKDCSLLPSLPVPHSCSPGTLQHPRPCPALPCPALPARHTDAGAALDGCLDGRLGWTQTQYKTVCLYPKNMSLKEKYKLKEISIFISLRKLILEAHNFTMSKPAVSRNGTAWQHGSIMEILTSGCNKSLTAACQW